MIASVGRPAANQVSSATLRRAIAETQPPLGITTAWIIALACTLVQSERETALGRCARPLFETFTSRALPLTSGRPPLQIRFMGFCVRHCIHVLRQPPFVCRGVRKVKLSASRLRVSCARLSDAPAPASCAEEKTDPAVAEETPETAPPLHAVTRRHRRVAKQRPPLDCSNEWWIHGALLVARPAPQTKASFQQKLPYLSVQKKPHWERTVQKTEITQRSAIQKKTGSDAVDFRQHQKSMQNPSLVLDSRHQHLCRYVLQTVSALR